jgi:hypothetical protein
VLSSLGVAAWLLLAAKFGHDFPPTSAPRLLLAVGQAAAIALLVLVLARSIARLDELERRIHEQAVAAAAAIVVTAIAAWAFFESAGLPRLDWAVFALPVFTVAWAIGVIRISLSYR